MIVPRAYRYRFYPTPEQAAQLERSFGCARFVYNWGLARRTEAFYRDGQRLYYRDLAACLTDLKRAPETPWLAEVSAVVLQQALLHLDAAFARFFKGTAAYPTFKCRKGAQSCTYMANAFTFRAGQLTLAKHAAPLAIRWSRPLPAGTRPSSVTVNRSAGGRYHVALLVEEAIAPLPEVQSAVGLDLNTAELVCSTGRRYRVPRRLKELEAHRRRYQRACRRKVAAAKARLGLAPSAPLPKGTRLPVSNNLARARRKAARVSERIADVRRDWQHKTTTSLVRENQVIAVEDLNVRGMTASARGTCEAPGRRVKQKAGLNRSVLDVGFAEIRRQLEYKGRWYGRTVVAIDRWYPSSRRCSACGRLLGHLPLAQRRWTCPACGVGHERDENAAKNILAAGKAILQGAAALRIHA